MAFMPEYFIAWMEDLNKPRETIEDKLNKAFDKLLTESSKTVNKKFRDKVQNELQETEYKMNKTLESKIANLRWKHRESELIYQAKLSAEREKEKTLKNVVSHIADILNKDILNKDTDYDQLHLRLVALAKQYQEICDTLEKEIDDTYKEMEHHKNFSCELNDLLISEDEND